MHSVDDELLQEAREILEEQTHLLAKDELICECCSISLSEIRELKKENEGHISLELLQKELKLGSGCSSCAKSYAIWSKKI